MASNEDIQIEEAFAQKRMSAGTFMRLMSYTTLFRSRIALNLVFTVLATASQLLGPKFIQIGIDRYLTNFTTMQVAMTGILVISAIYLVNLLANWGLSAAQVKSAIAIGHGARSEEHTS